MYITDNRIVLTLDAGGTNFVFSAMQGYNEIAQPIRLDAVSDSIQGCLDVLEHGFNLVKEQLSEEPVAISFAFPGPADYERGIIGDLGNFPAFRGGVAMGPYLQEKFGIPVYINNDGNLFAYGEALAGFLPEVNQTLQLNGVTRQYRNLLGITLGTGFGGGVVLDGVLLRGDNGCGGDVWCMRNERYPQMIAEEGVSIRAVRRVYQEESGQDVEGLTPYDIYQIAEGKREGNPQAAKEAFRQLGEVAGEAMANALNIVDGVAVIGGGLAGAGKYILPGVVAALKGMAGTFGGNAFPILQMDVFNWEDEADREKFVALGMGSVKVPCSDREIPYLNRRSICVGLSKNGASTSIMYGAYAYALRQLDRL